VTFHFRDDVETMSRPALIAYVNQLESALQPRAEQFDQQGVINLVTMFGLTPTEAELLALLADGRAHSKQGVLDMLYASRPNDMPELKIVDVFICKLRRKLADSPIGISTIWGHGYQIEDPAPLKAAMAGEKVEGCAEHDRPRIGRPRAGQSRPWGSVTDTAVEHLRQIADSNGVSWTTSREFSKAIGDRTAGSTMIRQLELRQYLEVVHKPVLRGGQWAVRVLAK
jgi:DNA-binding winged helix-turn-helix (wHTH) protein